MIKVATHYAYAQLCYVDEQWAWFTTCPLEKQWGDDWNDAPYEHNAGDPYYWKPYMAMREHPLPKYHLFYVSWTGPYELPAWEAFNSRYSVEMINAGETAWLKGSQYETMEIKPIYAGTPFIEFIPLVHEAGGKVFVGLEVVQK